MRWGNMPEEQHEKEESIQMWKSDATCWTILNIAMLIWLALQIFLMDTEAGDRHVASGQKWHEDLQWAKRLDQGWNLSAVKQVPDPSSCLCFCSPCPCFVFTSDPLCLLLLLLMVPLFLVLFPFP